MPSVFASGMGVATGIKEDRFEHDVRSHSAIEHERA